MVGMFNDLMSKIFRDAGAIPSEGTPSGTTIESATAPTATTQAASAVSAVPCSRPQSFDVTAFFDDLAGKNVEQRDWRSSIADLMELLGLESTLSARQQLARELHYPGDENDEPTMNVWLHRQVLRQVVENGGQVPRELL